MKAEKTKKQLTTREIITVGILTTVTAALAQIAIPLPFTPMPISCGLVAVYISGILQKPHLAVLTQVCYLLLGAAGVPVFGQFRGGMGALLGPTGGYLIVYPVMAGIVALALNSQKSRAAERRQSKKWLYAKAGIALLVAHTIIYLGGTTWLSVSTGTPFSAALALAVYPFIPLDIVKLVFCLMVIVPLRSRMLSMGLLAIDAQPDRAGNAPVMGDGARDGNTSVARDGAGEGSRAIRTTKEVKTIEEVRTTIEAREILQKAENGKAVTLQEAEVLLDPQQTNLEELIQTAGKLTRKHFGNEIGMCAIYPARVGRCSGDCAFCSQSAHHSSNVASVGVEDLDEDAIILNARELYRCGVRRYSLVTSGESLTDAEFERIVHLYERLSEESEMELCASLGSLTRQRAVRLKQAGVTRYHHNIETSRSFFPQICSTHSYDDKLTTIQLARAAELQVCCGGILGMGETPKQRAEMALALKELDVDCIPINILDPIPGTRLADQKPMPTDDILRTIAVFRLILQHKALRFAGGRTKALGQQEYRGYEAGINAMIAGNYLTTSGKPLTEEIQNLEQAGFVCAGK